MVLTEQEKSGLYAIMGLLQHQKPATVKEMVDLGRWSESIGDEQAIISVFDRLVEAGLVARSGDAFSLTRDGQVLIKQLDADEFGRELIACQGSAAYRRYCQIVYGAGRCHFDMLTQQQFERLVGLLCQEKPVRILDLGCATGEISEAIARATGAETVGIDISRTAIEAARERHAGAALRLSFEVMDMDDLRFPDASFDAVVAIDTLYFAQDLGSTLLALKRCLRKGGRLAIFYSTHLPGEDAGDSLAPDRTRLALALQSCGLAFQTWDYTEDERALWEKALQAAKDLKADFESEGNLRIYQSRQSESAWMVEMFKTGRNSRYLYDVKA